MATMSVETERMIESSVTIGSIATSLNAVKEKLSQVKIERSALIAGTIVLNSSIRYLENHVAKEAVKLNSMGKALESIANKYQEVENRLTSPTAGAENSSTETSGTDKRNILQKLFDWMFGKEADAYDTTTIEQERAADEAIRQKLRQLLQNEKYSQSRWDRASIAERKQILQDYMNEVMKIYGLKDCKTTVRWEKVNDQSAGITMGYYSPSSHRVTLNEKVLSGSTRIDSYELFGTVNHELRHAYQHEAISHPTRFMVSDETIQTWDNNFKNYISYDNDPKGYRSQAVEVDARSFQV